MFYQSFKYFLVRTGLTLFLALLLGYMALYFVHEVALPNVYFNDLWIKWIVVGICLFFGFVVYGIFGEHRFLSALNSLKHIDLKTAGPDIREQFQALVEFTRSSYFLPGKGHQLREQLIQDYAEFLMSTGSEDPQALNVFLKAYLQDPKQTRFRNILVSTLTRKEELTDQEIDLMLVIMKTEGYEDRELLAHMVTVFLKQEWFTNKSEPVFLKALQLKTGQENQIISFMLPHLLDKKRTDYLAVSFYLESLSSLPEEQQGTLAYLVSTSYCEDRFKVIDPDLHDRCKRVFDSLETQTKERLLRVTQDAKVSEQWKKVKLFHSDDKQALERLKVYTGLSPTFWQVVGKKITGQGGGIFHLIKRMVFRVFDGLNVMGNMSTATKLVVAGLFFGGLFYAAVAVDWKSLFPVSQPVPTAPPEQVAVPPVQVFTLQVAAVKEKSQADVTVRQLKKKKVEDVYVVKIPRTEGGFWYKVRVGKFRERQTAEKVAAILMNQKKIRSYFIIALEERPQTPKPKTQ
ncbi:MAG: SPOR domain-containing protein [Nitrospinota bacterium]|nr:SPOR domain-containing protein [Nitrospinota bacterium]